MPKKVNLYAVASICFDCENACGKCSWSEYDKETCGTRFKIPEGAIATPVYDTDGKLITHRIAECPLFIPTPPRHGVHGALSVSENDDFLKDYEAFYQFYDRKR